MWFKSYKNNRQFTLMPKDIYDIPLNSSWVEESFTLKFEIKSNISCQIHFFSRKSCRLQNNCKKCERAREAKYIIIYTGLQIFCRAT